MSDKNFKICRRRSMRLVAGGGTAWADLDSESNGDETVRKSPGSKPQGERTNGFTRPRPRPH
jgi:hypothetical protein